MMGAQAASAVCCLPGVVQLVHRCLLLAGGSEYRCCSGQGGLHASRTSV